jgi:2-polyprenyl-3-methyl-5-hydroxy-6-metoxy-1,4-benzoquinol methylase
MNKWDRLYSKGENFKPLNEIYLNLLIAEIEKLSCKKIKNAIDLGCGTGDALLKLAKHGLVVTGIDGSEVAVSMANKILQAKGYPASSVTVGDLESIDVNGTFDIILCKLVYAFIKNKEKFLADVRTIMAPNSVFVLMTPVLYKDRAYSPADKPRIAVPFDDTFEILKKQFSTVQIFNHEYFGNNGDTVTFLINK